MLYNSIYFKELSIDIKMNSLNKLLVIQYL